MTYRVEFTNAARSDFRKLEAGIRARLIRKAEALAENPRPHGVTKLEGFADRYRVRVGDFRLLYEIRDGVLLVLVLRARHRREVYRAD